MSTDHSVLAKHKHYTDVLRFLVSQGWGAALEVLSSSGVDLASDAKVTISYTTTSGAEGLVLKTAKLAAFEARAKSAQGVAFATDELLGRRTFTVSRSLLAVELGGGALLVASKSVATAALTSIDKKKVAAKSKSFARQSAKAKKLGGTLWGVAKVPKRVRDRLRASGSADMAGIERIVFGASGLGPTKIGLQAHTSTDQAATDALAAIRSKIDRKILSSAVFRALGAGAIVGQLKLSTHGARLDANTSLTVPQVGLLARLAQRLVRAL